MRTLEIAGEVLCVEVAPHVADAIEARFGEFMTKGGRGAIHLQVEASRGFDPRFEEVARVGLSWDGTRAVLSGAATGWYDPCRREGMLRDAGGIGAIDAMVRLALSLALPSRNALFLHGAAIARGGCAVALIGTSGAGKSTAASALGAACDELIAVVPHGAGSALHSTPYWRGRPISAPLGAVLCLERGNSEARELKGADAVRMVLRHVQRFLSVPEIDAQSLAAAAALCRRVPIAEVRCPSGDGFIPFLERTLAEFAT